MDLRIRFISKCIGIYPQWKRYLTSNVIPRNAIVMYIGEFPTP